MDDDGRICLQPKLPALIAYDFLRRENKVIRFWRDEFLAWTGTHYKVVPKVEMNAAIARFMNSAVMLQKDEVVQFPTNMKLVDEVRTAISWDKNVLISPTREERSSPGGESADHLIPCRNGMLDLNTAKLLPHSSEYLFLNSLSIDYDPTLPEPTEFMQFIRSLWPDYNGSSEGRSPACRKCSGISSPVTPGCKRYSC